MRYSPSYGPDRTKWPTPNYQDFINNHISTICYLTGACFHSEDETRKDYESFEMDENVMDVLFSDVIGEAG